MKPDSYDYVVVGAGAAGCVLADRLTATADRTVLLLEAGGADDAPAVHATDIPSMVSLWGSPEATWPYATVPQPGLGGRVVPIPQGRLLGGGTSINAMMYVRGNPLDFDGWAAAGNAGWSYAEVLPSFRAVERHQGGDPAYRGRSGPIAVLDYPAPTVASEAFVAAAHELGYGATGEAPDYNGARQDGAPFYYQSSRSRPDRRCSAADAFLRPALSRPNLTVLTGAAARRIVVEDGAAIGVEYVRDGRTHLAHARAEIVVSSGALASPALLLRSGIGPADELRAAGVRPLLDLPGVGRNLQDHLLFGVGWESTVDLPVPQLLAEAGLFLRTAGRAPEETPDLQFFFGPVQFMDEKYKTDGPGFTAAPILVGPQSRGTVTLDPGDPDGPAVIDPHYLESGRDVDVLVEGIERARELAGTSAFARLRGRELAPGEDVDTRAGLVDYVRASASTVWHPAGTCRMGSDTGTGAGAVVDPALRVHGVRGLRVADASVMPTITTGNTQATALMIGHRAAELVLSDGSDGRDRSAATRPVLTGGAA